MEDLVLVAEVEAMVQLHQVQDFLEVEAGLLSSCLPQISVSSL